MRLENRFWLLLVLTIALSTLSKSMAQAPGGISRENVMGEINLLANLCAEGDFFLLGFYSKVKKEDHWQLRVEIFFLPCSLTWHFFTGPLECTLLQSMGERESKTVHVKPPQLQGGKKVRNASSLMPHWTVGFLSIIESLMLLQTSCKYFVIRLKKRDSLPVCWTNMKTPHSTYLFYSQCGIYLKTGTWKPTAWIHQIWQPRKLENINIKLISFYILRTYVFSGRYSSNPPNPPKTV